MKNFAKKIFRPIVESLVHLNLDFFDLNKLLSIKQYPRYRKTRNEWIRQGGKISKKFIILSDFDDKAGENRGHYFHQDLLVANFIHKNKPRRHIDVGSRIDGFVSNVASFRKIEVLDIRPLDNIFHDNIEFKQCDLMNPQGLDKADSISCLHAIEHFGLGRYCDPIDINGHTKGITNLINLLSKGGILYISFPISDKDKVYFNAHRLFKVDTIFNYPSIKENMDLVRFDYVDDNDNLHKDVNIQSVPKDIKYGCGIYTFRKR